MPYSRTQWINGETPLSAENLNNLEQGLANASENLEDALVSIDANETRLDNVENSILDLDDSIENHEARLDVFDGKFPIGTTNIADASITAAKLASAAVTQGKIASNAVTTGTIADGNVTTAKIGNKQVTLGKLEEAVQNSITGIRSDLYGVATKPYILTYKKGITFSNAKQASITVTFPQAFKNEPVSIAVPINGSATRWNATVANTSKTSIDVIMSTLDGTAHTGVSYFFLVVIGDLP